MPKGNTGWKAEEFAMQAKVNRRAVAKLKKEKL